MEDQSEINKLNKKITDLATKYDFDQDDGGGGTTSASRKAGRRYMELNDELMKLNDKIDNRVRKKAYNELISKYGKERIDRFETQENIATGMKVVGFFLGVPIAVGIISGIASSK